MNYVGNNFVQGENEQVIPHLGKMTEEEKNNANSKIPTLNETVLEIKEISLNEADMYWLDVENLNVHIESDEKY